MNRTKIEYANYTWNPLTGCRHNCWYCYARRLAEGRLRHRYPNGFEPTFWPERLDEPLKVRKPSTILVSSMGDLFGRWVQQLHTVKVLRVIQYVDWHTFLLLTKYPRGYHDFRLPSNAWAGATLDCEDQGADLIRLCDLKETAGRKWASFEPLLGPPGKVWNFRFLNWVVIGALTGPHAARHKPRPEWVQAILDKADWYSIPVFMKDNLRPHWNGEWRRELPKEFPQ